MARQGGGERFHDTPWHVDDHVGFVAEPGPEGNTVVRLRQVTLCVRFWPFPSLTAD